MVWETSLMSASDTPGKPFVKIVFGHNTVSTT